MAEVRLLKVDALDPDRLAEVTRLATAAAATDGVPPFSDQTLLRLREGMGQEPGATHLLCLATGAVVGYGNVFEGVGELVVDPAHRRQGHGHALVAGALANGAGPTGLKLWAHGNHPGAVRLAEKFDLHVTRELRQLRRPLRPNTAEPSAPELPDGVRIRPFRPGADEVAWLELNRRAFVDHPEQGRWSLADLTNRETEPWFDPAGFLLAERIRDGRLLGFHWTKKHNAALGEVYVLGVDPEAQGLKLGKILLLRGLRHLAARGCEEVMLYVDAANTGAVQLYERAGFALTLVDMRYERVSDHEGSATTPSSAGGQD